MKAISVRRPWPTAILLLGKDVENRVWRTDYRGPLLIHAGRTIDRAACKALKIEPGGTGLVGYVILEDCIERSRSKWAQRGAWHWILRDPVQFPKPHLYAGRLGLFDVPDRLLKQLGYRLP